MKEKNKKNEKLASDTNTQYNIILGFFHDSHSSIGQPFLSSSSMHFEEEIIQKTTMVVIGRHQSHLVKGPDQNDWFTEEAHNGHRFN